MLRHRCLRVCLLAMALVLTATTADAKTTRPHARQLRPSKPAAAGVVVGVDPETGLLGMPTRAQAASLLGLPGLSLNHSTDGLVVQHLPDGSLMLDLQGRFREYYIVHVDPQGHLLRQCLGDPLTIRRELVTPPPPALEER